MAQSLTALEQQLLYLLVANAGRVLTREELLDHVWGPDFIAEAALVDRHVRALRATLQPGQRPTSVIATVPGRGYTFLPASRDAGMLPRSMAQLPTGRGRVTIRRQRRPSSPALLSVTVLPEMDDGATA